MHNELDAAMDQLSAALETKNDNAALAAGLRLLIHGFRQLERIATAQEEIARLAVLGVQAQQDLNLNVQNLATITYNK